VRWTHEFQHRYFETLFSQAPFDETHFDFGQSAFEHAFVVTDILLMAAQTGLSLVHHRRPQKYFLAMQGTLN
jgi:hypothetical protein